jgi:hypothetical protein
MIVRFGPDLLPVRLFERENTRHLFQGGAAVTAKRCRIQLAWVEISRSRVQCERVFVQDHLPGVCLVRGALRDIARDDREAVNRCSRDIANKCGGKPDGRASRSIQNVGRACRRASICAYGLPDFESVRADDPASQRKISGQSKFLAGLSGRNRIRESHSHAH